MKFYLTYCSWSKDDTLKETGESVTPDRLYTSDRIKLFVKRCRERNAEWGIFSDYCGILFAHNAMHWYDLHPDLVRPEDLPAMIEKFEQSLAPYEEIAYYYDPATLHPLYQYIVNQSRIKDKVTWFSDFAEMP